MSENGRIFGRVEGELLLIDEDGGPAMTAAPTEPEPLPAQPIARILVSPGLSPGPDHLLSCSRTIGSIAPRTAARPGCVSRAGCRHMRTWS